MGKRGGGAGAIGSRMWSCILEGHLPVCLSNCLPACLPACHLHIAEAGAPATATTGAGGLQQSGDSESDSKGRFLNWLENTFAEQDNSKDSSPFQKGGTDGGSKKTFRLVSCCLYVGGWVDGWVGAKEEEEQ